MIALRTRWRRAVSFLAVVLLAASLVVLAATVGAMVIEYGSLRIRLPREKARLAELEAEAAQDVARVPALHAARARQTEETLARQQRLAAQSYLVIGASVFLLASANWLLAAAPPSFPCRERVLAASTTSTTSTTSRSRTLRLASFLSSAWWRPGLPDRTERPGVSWTGAAGSDVPDPATCRSASGGAVAPIAGDPDHVDPRVIDAIVARYGRGKETAIPALHAMQASYGYVPTAALERLCTLTDITPAQIDGVVSFYGKFRRQPVGEHRIQVCHGTACHVAGAPRIGEEIRRQLGIAADRDTDPRGRFTVDEVACLGCCTLAPVMRIDARTHGHLETDQIARLLEEAPAVRRNGHRTRSKERAGNAAGLPVGELRIGLGSCCVAGGSAEVYAALEKSIADAGVRVTVKRVGCVGMCHQTPLVEAIIPGRDPILYRRVAPQQARAIVRRHFRADKLARRLRNQMADRIHGRLGAGRTGIAGGGASEPRETEPRDPQVMAFLSRQQLIATEHSGELDPTDVDEYLRHDGFAALRHCVRDMTAEQVIATIQQSGLRGRGGGGFPTGTKWEMVRKVVSDRKFVICNGDEGDPGAFMDRMLMESYPYRIIEGLSIAAYAAGAREGIFYIRAEYPLAVERIREAIRVCTERGFLGEHILGTPLRLTLRVMEGAGAFVCGEETALLRSLEGERGTPRLRPPYPVEQGLWGEPTLINNVETLATVPWILRHGPAAFAAFGTPSSPGTKVFALAGKVRRGGLIEVPMGMTVRQIVEEIGGGIPGGRPWKAVQIGGPSGGCIPAALADTPVDFEALREVGAVMGSGGLVVLDETDCMVDIARYFLTFTQRESCGKCTYCRIGTRRMLDILDRICGGRGRRGDLERLEQLARDVGSGSLCGLGKTAPNPVLTTLRYFREEYQAHLSGTCPAGRCRALITYRVTDDCVGCTLCAQHCPADAIPFAPYEKHVIDTRLCTCCDLCRTRCPEDAIVVE